jgi:hypothetical protein
LVATVRNPPSCCDIDFGGPSLAFLMLAISRDPLGRDPHLFSSSSFSFVLAATTSDPLGHHDLSGLCCTSLVFVAALIFLVVILIFMLLVVVIGNAPSCGLGCNYW